MSQVCVNQTGICSTNCPNRQNCSLDRRSILQWFVATKANRGVYADSILSDVAEKRAIALIPIADGSGHHGTGYRPGAVRINKGMI